MNKISGSSRLERKKEKTRQKIIAVSMKLFQQQGFEATTMEQIAEEADIAKGTLYNYFPVKEAIVGAYIQRSFREQNAERLSQLHTLPDTRSRMVFVFATLLAGVEAQKEIFEKYLVYQMQNMVTFHQDGQVKGGLYSLAIEIIRLGQKDAEIRDDLPIYVLEDLFEFAFIEAVKQLYVESQAFDAHAVIAQCVDLFINGVGHR